jgi:hypothetical protein
MISSGKNRETPQFCMRSWVARADPAETVSVFLPHACRVNACDF